MVARATPSCTVMQVARLSERLTHYLALALVIGWSNNHFYNLHFIISLDTNICS